MGRLCVGCACLWVVFGLVCAWLLVCRVFVLAGHESRMSRGLVMSWFVAGRELVSCVRVRACVLSGCAHCSHPVSPGGVCGCVGGLVDWFCACRDWCICSKSSARVTSWLLGEFS